LPTKAFPSTFKLTMICESKSTMVEPGDGRERSRTTRLSSPARTREPSGRRRKACNGSVLTESARTRTHA
jgi:hypothetical protein